jgi:hypothetical protein
MSQTFNRTKLHPYKETGDNLFFRFPEYNDKTAFLIGLSALHLQG